MFELKCKIKIAGQKTWMLDKIASCEIVQDTESLSDTCRLTLPQKVVWKGESEKPIHRGDKIEVSLGYDSDLAIRFIGYITKIGTRIPIAIEAEDSMFLLKQRPAKKLAYQNVDLKKLLSDILPQGIKTSVLGKQHVIGSLRITDGSVAGVLDHLSIFGIKSFFKLVDNTPVLHCGLIFDAQQSVKYRFNDKEGTANIINNETEYVRKEDLKLKVKAQSIQEDNSRLTAEVGDADGQERTLYTYNMSQGDLRKWAEKELERLKYDGLSGSITVFGSAVVSKGDVLRIDIGNVEPSSFLVKKVSIRFGATYVQTIELERRIL